MFKKLGKLSLVFGLCLSLGLSSCSFNDTVEDYPEVVKENSTTTTTSVEESTTTSTSESTTTTTTEAPTTTTTESTTITEATTVESTEPAGEVDIVRDKDFPSFNAGKVNQAIRNGKALEEGKKYCFLTYDDGINTESTPVLLDLLDKQNVPATFFILGRSITNESAPIIKRAIKEGHGIGLHSFDHEYGNLYPGRNADPANIEAQYLKASEALKSVLGEDYPCTLWRYPGGHMSWHNMDAADAVLSKYNVNWIDWNVVNNDASNNMPTTVDGQMEVIKSTFTMYGEPDTVVVLMHDYPSKNITREALPSIVKYFKDKGYEFARLY